MAPPENKNGAGVCAKPLLGVPGYVTIPTWSPLLSCSIATAAPEVKLNR